MSPLNYYEILGISSTASAEEIRKAYGRKIREYPNQTHPAEFQKIREAYEVLKDEKKRAEYDRRHSDDGVFGELLSAALEEMSNEDFDAASELLEEMLSRYPDDPLVKSRLSECYYHLDELDEAKRLMVELVLEEPSNENYHFQLVLIYEEMEDYNRAINQMKKLIRLNPEEANYYLKQSFLYFKEEDYESAADTLEKKLKRQKESLIDFPLLSELYFLTYYQNKSAYRKQILERIKALATNEQERESLIEMLMKLCYDLKDDNPAYNDFVPMIRSLNRGKDPYVNDWLKEMEPYVRTKHNPAPVVATNSNTAATVTKTANTKQEEEDNNFWGCCCCIVIIVAGYLFFQ